MIVDIPDMDAPFDLTAARAAVEWYARLTDAEVEPDDEEAFDRSYRLAAHAAARHLIAALRRFAAADGGEYTP